MLIEDPSAEKRSEMLGKAPICNGKANGTPCKHYWLHIAKLESNNPDILKQGEFHRACLISPGFPVEFSEVEVPHTCNQYVPRRHGPLGFFRKYKYNPLEEKYDPLTPEEYKDSLKEVDDAVKSLPIIGQSTVTERQIPEVSKTDLEDLFNNRGK